MKSVILKIFSDEIDLEVHDAFVKFSKGIFQGKYLIECKKQKDLWNIKTSAEFVNFFVRRGLEKLKEPIDISGVIVSTLDLKSNLEFEFEKIKQFAGVKQIVINSKISPEKIISLMDKFPKAIFALSFSLDNYILKTKAKSPKNGKPSTKGDEDVKADFCSLKTSDTSIIDDLFFDNKSFKEIKIKHTININEIILPEGISDPVKMRGLAKRKGIITRIIKIDGNPTTKEKEFEA